MNYACAAIGRKWPGTCASRDNDPICGERLTRFEEDRTRMGIEPLRSTSELQIDLCSRVVIMIMKLQVRQRYFTLQRCLGQWRPVVRQVSLCIDQGNPAREAASPQLIRRAYAGYRSTDDEYTIRHAFAFLRPSRLFRESRR
jgi:hypothetical protein